MDEIKIINVDENGNEIQAIDWNIWRRERVEEVLDDNGKVIKIISHCVAIPIEQIAETKIQIAKSELQATDYISAKVGDALLECKTLDEVLSTLYKFRDKYSEVIENRKLWREQVNNPLNNQ